MLSQGGGWIRHHRRCVAACSGATCDILQVDTGRVRTDHDAHHSKPLRRHHARQLPELVPDPPRGGRRGRSARPAVPARHVCGRLGLDGALARPFYRSRAPLLDHEPAGPPRWRDHGHGSRRSGPRAVTSDAGRRCGRGARRPRGSAPGRIALRRAGGLDTLTDALAEALAAIGRPTVVVGHSLGGAVAQNLLRRGGRPAATVLLCSAPPYGLWRASMEMATTNLALWKAMFDLSFFGVAATDPRVIRDNMFPNGISEAEFRTVLSRLTDEALAATARTSGFPPFAPLPGPRSDLLVIGAGKDRFVPPLDVHLTGLYYGSRPRIVAGAGHMPMYEPAFLSETAGHILDWLPGIAAGD
ncbi:alpha/beta hydrolase [Tropicimonas aquimaris]|uniref:Alpha/beta hydrolase n=1 Tax=Tropicimonas aquimaris TaxID=914152 RepID=A0ABW3IXF0_9RHOB